MAKKKEVIIEEKVNENNEPPVKDYRIWPREDIHHRAFKNKPLAEAYAAKLKDLISIGEKTCGVYEVSSWKYYKTREDYIKDEEEYQATYPKIELKRMFISEEEMKESDEELKKKITKEPKKKVKKK